MRVIGKVRKDGGKDLINNDCDKLNVNCNDDCGDVLCNVLTIDSENLMFPVLIR